MRSLKFTLTFFLVGSLFVLAAMSFFALIEYRRVSKTLDRAMAFKPYPYISYEQLPPVLVKIVNEVEYPQSAICNEWSGLERAFSDNPQLHPDCTLTWELIKILMPAGNQGSFIKMYEDQLAFIRLFSKYSYNDQIEQLINRYSFGMIEGKELSGYQNASPYYFKKNLQELNLEQLAGLVIIGRNPPYFTPWEDNKMYLRQRTFLLNIIRPPGSPAY